jgi:mannose-P-dolichol utilization defect protein 1
MLRASTTVLSSWSTAALAAPVSSTAEDLLTDKMDRKLVLPKLLRDPAVALIGDQCYTSLIENLQLFHDIDCLKYAISKGLGFGIVLGGSIVKIPQIITILSSRSAQGLSLASYYLETFSCAISLAYNFRQGNPFSTFGETFFLTVQNVIITLMILYYSGQQSLLVASAIGFLLVFQALSSQTVIPSSIMSILYAATIPLTLSSKIPQIYTNFKNSSTGQLSVFAVFNYFLGTIARVFTTMTELNDPLMLAGNVLAATFNGILVIQVIVYWGKKSERVPAKPGKAD